MSLSSHLARIRPAALGLTPRSAARLDDWRYLGLRWTGWQGPHAEWLAVQGAPHELRCATLSCPSEGAARDARLEALGIELVWGEDRDALVSRFGEPDEELQLLADRETSFFRVGGRKGLLLETTVRDEGGLVHVSIVAADALEVAVRAALVARARRAALRADRANSLICDANNGASELFPVTPALRREVDAFLLSQWKPRDAERTELLCALGVTAGSKRIRPLARRTLYQMSEETADEVRSQLELD